MVEQYKIIFLIFNLESIIGMKNLYEYFNKQCIKSCFIVCKNLDKRFNSNYNINKYLKENNINFLNYNNEDLKQYNAKYIFYQSPYLLHYSSNLQIEKLKQLAKICYIPYGYSIWSPFISGYPLNFLKYVDYFFHENELNKKDFINYLKNKKNTQLLNNSYITGCAKLYNLNANSIEYKNLKSYHVGWNPRWTPKQSTFNEYYHDLINYFKNNSNNELLIRFHPLDQNKKKINSNISNINIDNNPEYKYFFNNINILISDLSTIIPEFFITGKPIIYTYHNSHKPNSFGIELLKCVYIVRNKEELFETINNLLKGNDILKDKRIEFIKKYYDYNPLVNIEKVLDL